MHLPEYRFFEGRDLTIVILMVRDRLTLDILTASSSNTQWIITQS